MTRALVFRGRSLSQVYYFEQFYSIYAKPFDVLSILFFIWETFLFIGGGGEWPGRIWTPNSAVRTSAVFFSSDDRTLQRHSPSLRWVQNCREWLMNCVLSVAWPYHVPRLGQGTWYPNNDTLALYSFWQLMALHPKIIFIPAATYLHVPAANCHKQLGGFLYCLV